METVVLSKAVFCLQNGGTLLSAKGKYLGEQSDEFIPVVSTENMNVQENVLNYQATYD